VDGTTILLMIAGVMLAVSGVVKIHASGRVKLGVPVLAIIEVFAGLALSVMAFASPPTADAGFRMVVGAVILVLVSSGAMARKFSTQRKQLGDSEGVRLMTYVKYISVKNDSDA
jgi:uncharacterized membrane-anchored protein